MNLLLLVFVYSKVIVLEITPSLSNTFKFVYNEEAVYFFKFKQKNKRWGVWFLCPPNNISVCNETFERIAFQIEWFLICFLLLLLYIFFTIIELFVSSPKMKTDECLISNECCHLKRNNLLKMIVLWSENGSV